METLVLIRPDVAFEAEYIAMLEEFAAAGDERRSRNLAAAKQDFAAFVRQLQDAERGIGLPEGFVPATEFWTVKNSVTVIGSIVLRHELSPALAHYGGHIGYQIRPSQRGKGYGTRQLALCLPEARKLGLSRVMVTCDVDNIASARVIEHNGGVLDSQGMSTVTRKMISRYWIDLSGHA